MSAYARDAARTSNPDARASSSINPRTLCIPAEVKKMQPVYKVESTCRLLSLQIKYTDVKQDIVNTKPMYINKYHMTRLCRCVHTHCHSRAYCMARALHVVGACTACSDRCVLGPCRWCLSTVVISTLLTERFDGDLDNYTDRVPSTLKCWGVPILICETSGVRRRGQQRLKLLREWRSNDARFFIRLLFIHGYVLRMPALELASCMCV